MGVQFYVYELTGEHEEEPQRVSWQGWREVKDWLQEEGLEADARMARQVEFRQIRQVVEETAGVDELPDTTYVAPLPDLRGQPVMFGIETGDGDFIVAPVPLQWLLPQAANGWEVAMTFSVERVGGRNTDGYFNDDA